MQETPTQYKGILLDAPFFAKPFSDAFRELLVGSKLYVAATYESVVAVFRDGLVGKAQQIFSENLAVTARCSVEKLSHSSNHYSDIIGAALHLSERAEREGARYLLATSSELLIQIIVLRKLRLDIYDLTWDKYMPMEQFPQYEKQYAFKQQSNERVPTANLREDPIPGEKTRLRYVRKPRYKKELELYDEQGQPVALVRNTCSPGSEAVLYQCAGKDGYIAKVFLPPDDRRVILTREKIGNIYRFLETEGLADCDWAKIPKQLLYKEPQKQNVVGFVMEKVDDCNILDSHPVLEEENGNIRVTETLQLHIDLVRKMTCLGLCGFYVHDFNTNNFAWTRRNPGRILMLDTDSFCSGNYFSTLQMPLLLTREKHLKGKLDKLRFVENCLELSYIFGAWLLMRGRNALQADGNLRDGDSVLWSYMPPNVRTLIKGVLQNKMGHVPFFDAMIHELYQASIRPEWRDLTYGMILRDWEEKRNSWGIEGLELKQELLEATSRETKTDSKTHVPKTGGTVRSKGDTGARSGPRVAVAERNAAARMVYDDSFEKTKRMRIKQAPSPVAVPKDRHADTQRRNGFVVKFPDKLGADQRRKGTGQNRLLLLISIVLILIVLCAGVLLLYHAFLHDLGWPLPELDEAFREARIGTVQPLRLPPGNWHAEGYKLADRCVQTSVF